jgi:DNA-binding NtrC family response regulator
MTVLLVDDDRDLLDMLGEAIGHLCNLACLSAPSYDAMVALGGQALGCQLAILDVNLGPDRPSGIDAYRWLSSHGFQGRIVFLTGHARGHPVVEQAHSTDAAGVVQKPVSLEQIRTIVEGP